MRLSHYTQGRDNNFNLIRLAAAWAVLLTHSFALVTGSDQAEPLRLSLGITLGSMAVDIFFLTSGFLVTASLLARRSVGDFIWSRVLRIYPALFVVVGLMVFVLGLGFTTLPASEFLMSAATQKFALKNATLATGVSYSLPGVFENLPWKRAVNGSLWTMPTEVRMYATLAALWAALYLFGPRREHAFRQAVVALAGLALATNFADHFGFHSGNDFWRLSAMFFTGAACQVLKERLVLSGRVFALLLGGVLLSALGREAFFIVYTLSLAYLLLWLAYVPAGAARRFNRLGDYSYGVYIYAFPVQQSLMALVPDLSVAQMIAASTAVTLTLAALSWHLVEKRALALKGRLTAKGSAPGALEGA